ncbi:hypothetical protein HXX76_013786 [Chlamydomonas incerta]|uniref:START domain-containing protein n=1 Tax=Chlamydomonas incerta TaxID=51695 RepID=A0A835SI73_CHLIN|nr:hypothetical protein HXX76_013786 [Chlamydomonas incerta]|eukprot:KAG2425372.1 hypothetical protein HXX76_013786 [Chlamydomonas incerta]
MAPIAVAVFLSGVVAGRMLERRQQRRRAGDDGSARRLAEDEAAAAAAAVDAGAAQPPTPPELQLHPAHLHSPRHTRRVHPLTHSDSFLQTEPPEPTAEPAAGDSTAPAPELAAAHAGLQAVAPPPPQQQRRWRLLGIIPIGGRGGKEQDRRVAVSASGGGDGGGGAGPLSSAATSASAFAAAAATAGGTSTGTQCFIAGGGPVTPRHPHVVAAAVPAATPSTPATGRALSIPGPSPAPSRAPSLADTAATAAAAVPDAATHLEHPRHVWYVGEQDLHYFRLRAEQDVPVPGAGPWTHLMDKEAARAYRYTAHRRSLPNGLTEYRSVTVIPDTSPLECRWEGFMVSAEVLEAGDQRQRQQVVRWIRTFPFGFISDRQYVIARALFAVTPDGAVHAGLPPPARLVGHPAGPAASVSAMPVRGLGVPGGLVGEARRRVADLYVVTKSIGHPGAADGQHGGRVVAIPQYYSMWRCRTVACPWGGSRPAVEVVLLHSEDMRIPERLARMAIAMGMTKFVSTMAAAVPGFVAERRGRGMAPTQLDPQAYGHHHHVYGRSARAAAARAAEEHEAAAAAPKPGGSSAVMGAAKPHRPLGTAVSPAGAELGSPLSPTGPATPHPLHHAQAPRAAAQTSSAAGTPASAASQSWTPLTATPSSTSSGGGGGSSAFSAASTPTGPARALWRPHLAFSPGEPYQSPTDTAGAAGSGGGGGYVRSKGGVPRFSLAQVTMDGGVAAEQAADHEEATAGSSGSARRPGLQVHGGAQGAAADGAAPGAAAGGGGEGAVADAWWSLGRAMTSTGLWRSQDLPQVSSAWGTDPGAGRRRRGGGDGLRRRVLLPAAAVAGVLLALRAAVGAARRPQRSRAGGARAGAESAAAGIAASAAAAGPPAPKAAPADAAVPGRTSGAGQHHHLVIGDE